MNIQELSMEEYYENIVSKQSQMSTDAHNLLISQFHSINKSIQYKLQQYTKLISAYLLNVQDKFLISFTKVLQKMGNDLMLAQQAYKSIDKEVMAQQKCTKLAQDKIFFINESNYYHQQFLFKSKQAGQLKEKNYLLIKQNTGLKEKLFQKVKQNMVLKQKLKKLSKINSSQLNSNQQQSPQHSPQKQQLVSNQQPLQLSPQKKQQITERFQQTNERRLSSYGRQTKEQRRQKQEEKEKDKKNLLINIRKQLKIRDRINLDQIVNRSVVEKLQDREFFPQQVKKMKFFEKSQRQPSRVMRLEQSQKRSRSIMSSTAGTSFPLSRTPQSFNKRRTSFNYMRKMD